MEQELVKSKDNTKKELSEKTREVIFEILTIACIVIMAIAVTPKTLQNDTYYTLKCGEYIFEHGVFDIKQDPFSWHGLSYTWPHWLYDLIMYVFYAMCGRFWEVGIYVLTIILTSILGFSLFKTSEKMSKNKVVSAICTLFAIYLLKGYIAARAQLVTFILFVLEIFFIECLLERNKKKYGGALLVIAFLIVQLHCAVFPMFFVFALPYIAEYIFNVLSELSIYENINIYLNKLLIKLSHSESRIEKLKNKIEKLKKNIEVKKIKREKYRKDPYKVIIEKNPATIILIIVLVIALVIGFLNPMGTGAFTYTYKIYKGNTIHSINEHLPLTLADNNGFAIMLSLMFIILIVIDIKVRLKDLLMFGGTLFLAFKARRQVSLVIIMCIPILAKFISAFLEKYDKSLTRIIMKMITGLIGGSATLLLIFLIAKDIYKLKSNDDFIDSSVYPVEAVRWLKNYMNENDITPEELRLYNEYNYGSYLIFKDIPVFIDSRCDLYTPEFNKRKDIFSDALSVPNLNSNYEEVFKEYGVRYVMLYCNDGVNVKLEKDSNYNLLYNDGFFRVYQRISVE